MATKKRRGLQSTLGELTFINYKFDAETKTAFEKWFAAKEPLFTNAIFDTLRGEYKLSLSWDEDKECVIAAMTGKDESLNPKKCLTIRSADWVKAIAACAYVHTVVFSGEIWDVDTSTDMV